MAPKNIFVAGHRGMVGRSLCRALSTSNSANLITASKAELDLTNQLSVDAFFKQHQIDEVYLAAAKVGGIHANNAYSAEFIYQNLMIQSNVIHSAHANEVKKLLFLGSSCIYPKFANQPISENELLTGLLEPTNESYAIAKIAGIKLCESYRRQYGRDYRSVMPTNLYGPYDNFDPQNGHVIPALLHKFRHAITNNESFVEIWGSGQARREFLHVDDLASACLFLMAQDESTFWNNVDPHCSHINVGTGNDCSIKELAEQIRQVTGFRGELRFDTSKPEGTPVKRLDTRQLTNKGWKPTIALDSGLEQVWDWYKSNL